MNFDRRSFLKGGLALGGAAAIGGLAGCSPSNNNASATNGTETYIAFPFTKEDFEVSSVVVEPIAEFVDEHTYDIVVVGAGTSGLPAVMTALEEGATVACLQKESVSVSQGRGSSGVIFEESTDKGILEWKQAYREAVSYRYNPDLLEFYVQNSGETLMWMDQMGERVGFPAAVYSNQAGKVFSEDSVATICQHFFGMRPQSNNDLIAAMAEVAEQEGADFYYSTPAVQLIQDDSGSVTGVVGEITDGYVKFNATTAVILATGDYQNNDSMVDKFSPDLSSFNRKQSGKTGDGILMSALAGGQLTPVGHCKQMHDMDAAPLNFAECPWLAVNMDGERFMNEEIPMISWNLSLRELNKQDDPGKFCRIFDSNFEEYQQSWGSPAEGGVVFTSYEQLEPYIVGAQDEPKGVFPDLINTHKCDTLDELAEKLDIPADSLKASVEEYNKLCEQGVDTEFGKKAKYLNPIDTPPYYGIGQWMRITAICSGIQVDGNYQVVDKEDNPIPGLYAVGFGAGDLCGDVDWSFYLGGMSCGSCMTSGRYATIHAIKGDWTPSHPAKWGDVRHLYFED